MAIAESPFFARRSLRGISLIFLVVLPTGLLHALGILQIVNGPLYDFMVRFTPLKVSPPTRILLIEARPETADAGDDHWLKALENLQDLGAGQIVFNFTPGQVSPRFYAQAKAHGNVLFGRTLETSVEDPAREYLTPWPEAARAYEPPFGVVAIPPASYGIHRHQRTVYQIQKQPHFALEAAAVQRLLNVNPALPENDYLIDFYGGPSHLPVVSLERVLNGGLIPELVNDRSVLVGLTSPPATPGLHTPLGGLENQEMLSLLEFQGYALATLLENRIIHTTPSWLVIVILLLITLVNLILYQWINLHAYLWLTGGLVLFYLALGWLLPPLTLHWPPVIAMTVAQLSIFALLLRDKAVSDELSLRQMVTNISERLHERLIPASFYTSQEPWAQIITLINQTLDLNRLIFLERIPGEPRLREIRALNCSLEDIDERRRDYRRTPYSTAIAENRPIQLSRHYLNPQPDEDQYLAPLSFGGEILGFWAIGIDPLKVTDSARFTEIIEDFSAQISELLFHRQQWQYQQRLEEGTAVNYLRLEGGRVIHKTLKNYLELLGRRLENLEETFNGLSTATMLYDLFGRVVQINDGMQTILKKGDLGAYNMTAMDLLSTLGKMETLQSRRILQYVTLEKETISLPAYLPGTEDRFHILHLRPVARALGAQNTETEILPFQLRGILFELIDITRLHRLFRLKEQVIERINYQLRNDMESMLLAADLLKQEELPVASRNRVMTVVQQKVKDAMGLMNEAQQHLLTDLDIHHLERYPVDPKKPLQAAMDALGEKAKARQLQWTTDLPELTSLVLAEPNILEEILTTILEILVQDAAENSTITLSLQERERRIIYHFANEGFGFPDERFQDYLFGSEEVTTSEFRKLRQAIQQIRNWEGELTASSEIGRGIRIILCLRGFI